MLGRWFLSMVKYQETKEDIIPRDKALDKDEKDFDKRREKFIKLKNGLTEAHQKLDVQDQMIKEKEEESVQLNKWRGDCIRTIWQVLAEVSEREVWEVAVCQQRLLGCFDGRSFQASAR